MRSNPGLRACFLNVTASREAEEPALNEAKGPKNPPERGLKAKILETLHFYALWVLRFALFRVTCDCPGIRLDYGVTQEALPESVKVWPAMGMNCQS